MTANTQTVFESEAGDFRVEVSDESATHKRLSIEISVARVDKAFERAYRDLRQRARVKGFRPGKTPRSVLERLYGPSLPEEIERALVVETLPKAIELAGLQPLVEPGVEAGRPEAGSPFSYTARVELKPEIELPELVGLPAERPTSEVGEDEVVRQLEALRERNAPLVEEPEGSAAESGHFVTIDFVGRIEDEPFEGGSAQGQEVELGSGRLVPGFEDQLIGAVAGDERRVEIQFPDDYGNPELCGKQAAFDVQVQAVKRRIVPDLDDEFAKDLGDFETLGELRDRIRSDLETERQRAADVALRRSVMESLIARTDFEVPPGIVERQLQHQLSSFQREYAQHVPADLLQSQLGRMAEEGRPAAERRVREAFLLEAVAKQQEMEASDEDVDARIDEMAAERNVKPAELRKLAREQGWHEAIRSELTDRKALEFLAESANVEDISEAALPSPLP
jgi:trigger factor